MKPFLIPPHIIKAFKARHSFPDFAMKLIVDSIAQSCAATTPDKDVGCYTEYVLGCRYAACCLHGFGKPSLTEDQLGVWFDASLKRYWNARIAKQNIPPSKGHDAI